MSTVLMRRLIPLTPESRLALLQHHHFVKLILLTSYAHQAVAFELFKLFVLSILLLCQIIDELLGLVQTFEALHGESTLFFGLVCLHTQT